MADNVLIFVEQRSGSIHPASLQMFTAAAEMSAKTGGAIHAVVVGESVGDVADVAIRHGACCVHVADDPELRLYRAVPYTRALCDAVEAADARIVLLATTSLSRDLAPRVAARTGAALATDCLSVSCEDGLLQVTRAMYCAKCVAKLTLAADRLQIVSIRPNTFPAGAPAPEAGSTAVTKPLPVSLTEQDLRVAALDLVRSSDRTRDVAEADIIVSGGRSLESEGNFAILHELAEVLDGAVGASRAAVDAGFQPHSRQVGLTGKVVTPRLYIACGIDGAIQHLAGMRGSKIIVAINTKAEAPIFGVATYGCVADLFTLVPLLTDELRRGNGTG